MWWFWWLGVEVDALGTVAAEGNDDERQARNHEWQTQQLAHGDDAAQQLAQLGIGHAHKLNEEADDAVTHHKHAHKRALGQ